MADLNSKDLTSPHPDCEIQADYTEIVVIRHGETEWNADRRIQGQLDLDLNHIGRQQAAAVAARLSKGPKISAVHSSDLKRAHDTAEAIANCCGVLQVVRDPDLRERHMGELQGVLFGEAGITRPEAYKAFASPQRDVEIPGGGESIDQLYERCTSALQRIAKENRGKRVVVVTHGAVIEQLHRRGSPDGRSAKISARNAAVNVFHLFDDGKWSIESWGDVSHLRGLFQ